MSFSRMLSMMCAVALFGSVVVYAGEAEPALGGYCPVCLVKMNKLVEGNAQFSSTYDGKTYLFPQAKQKKMFDENPAAFVPTLGGNCTVCKIEKREDVPGKAEFSTVHDGRLFLFPSEKEQKMFAANPGKYANADLALGGNCAVCMVKKGVVAPGKPEFTSVYDGKRYLFPDASLQAKFDKNPAEFAPTLGGNCTVCKVEMNNDVPGKAEYHAVHNDRLYLFPSAKQLDMFRANPEKYADVDLALGGKCTVCKVEMGKDVEGNSEFAVDHNGKRYLFPGSKQLEMFKRNPAKYAVN